MRLGIAVSVLLLWAPISAWSYEPERAKANLASDFATCAAYYMVMGEGSPELKNDPRLDAVTKTAWEMAVELSNAEVTNARIELDSKQMMAEMKFDWSNAAIIINKYADQCKALLEDPTPRLQYWLNKKDE